LDPDALKNSCDMDDVVHCQKTSVCFLAARFFG
jgi:hypothetical protein